MKDEKEVSKQTNKEKERWSKWFLKAIIIAVFFYIIRWGFVSFYANDCLKCVLPHFVFTGAGAVIILAILNEIMQFFGK